MYIMFHLYLHVLIISVVFFFFKQKTAYEMRISDWSSDVCSSDDPPAERRKRDAREQRQKADPRPGEERGEIAENPVVDRGFGRDDRRALPQAEDHGGEQHRERGEKYGAIERMLRARAL